MSQVPNTSTSDANYEVANSTGANVRGDINNILDAILTMNSGSSAPSYAKAYTLFADTNAGIMKMRNAANDGFINLFTLTGGVDVDAASNFNEDVTFTGASANIVLINQIVLLSLLILQELNLEQEQTYIFITMLQIRSYQMILAI